MKRTILLTGVVALASAALPSSYAAAGVAFVRPVIAYVAPEADGYDDAGYIGVAAGATLGATRQHEIGGEIGGTGWEFDERFGSIRSQGEENYVPILANYRYYVQPAGAKVRVFFGPSIGFTSASYEIEVSGPGLFQKDDSTEVLFTIAGNVGVDFQLNDKLSLNVGYRYLYIEGGDTELLGTNIDLDESKAHLIFAGLNIRF